MRSLLICFILCFAAGAKAQYDPVQMIQGNWMGIDMYQDEETYDGKNFFLPNEEFIHGRVKERPVHVIGF